ncbi:DMT family transporter [Paenibacillus yanchengensis]|uniref:DMT family transporter n=1 Tax=Paenibacillus yanchengensis TaxID=2035833 RepID=A0ABW4YQ14_9BACL
MKHIMAVFWGAASYGILSTFVVLAYDRGFQLGEVVGAQLFFGLVLITCLVLAKQWKEKKKNKLQSQQAITIRENDEHVRLDGKKAMLLMVAGIPQAATGLLYYHTLKYVPASLAIILLFQFVWISVLIQSIRQRKWPQAMVLVSLAVVIVGTVFAAGILEDSFANISMIGIGFGLLAAVSYTLFLLISGNVYPKANPVYRSFWMIAGAFITLSIIYPPTFLFNGRLFSELALFGLILGCFGAFIPPLLFAYGIPKIGEGAAGILGAVELPVAVFMSMLVLKEEVGILKWMGVILVLIGIVIPELTRKKRSPIPKTR